MAWPVNPLGGNTIDRRAGCGKTARPVRREGGPKPIGPPYPYHHPRRAPPNRGTRASGAIPAAFSWGFCHARGGTAMTTRRPVSGGWGVGRQGCGKRRRARETHRIDGPTNPPGLTIQANGLIGVFCAPYRPSLKFPSSAPDNRFHAARLPPVFTLHGW